MEAAPELKAIAYAILKAAENKMRQAYEEAGLSGLCAEGRWEYALDSLHALDLSAVLQEALGDQPSTRKNST